ncbi:Formamidopyrimidine-DNA glycosylase [Roseivivax jejudonensis]|uniref:Formamidopyrimidine-DNA glycosylase n=1 Tax=Roseivivax jejudonensis TaxID=1529041 RepID=A0A1X6Y3D8_9RHOB|nr:DNA-formamidopyrimidine glycosylase family protein [Roseivivax jejudonensis]SLN09561.1 Formamidopyrimidine-DNA glycosylase [Roseivivax jejudonensis]
MPELPECEANRRRVEADCLNRTIERVELGEVTHMDLPGDNARGRLTGRQFTETRRHGKAIFAGSETGPWIVVHLGMTGSLRPYDAGGKEPDYAKVTFVFEGDRRLAFRNPRKFGTMAVIDDPDAYIAEKRLGPDALDIGANAFADVMGRTRGAVKSALMAQTKLAGIGNLWSDEALYRAGIAPETRADALGPDRTARLHEAVHDVLGHLVSADADYSQIPDDWLFPHRTSGAACPACGGRIEKSKVGGRTAYACADHQEAA